MNCMNCKAEFDAPEVKRPDAGITNGIGILGMEKMDPVKFCPECFSTKIVNEEEQQCQKE